MRHHLASGRLAQAVKTRVFLLDNYMRSTASVR